MKSNRWNTHTTKIFMATYSATFILIAATAILKISLMKILFVYASIFLDMFVFVKLNIGFLISGRLPPPGTNPLFEFLDKIATTIISLNLNEHIVSFILPIILLLIAQFFINEQAKISQP